MADYVFKKLEDMLPELEDLERKGVFSREELRIIIKKRTEFEYKLVRKLTEKEDFIRYLQYEISVDMLRKRRMQRLGLNTKYSPAEITILKRTHQTFQRALRRYRDDVKLWLQYVDFCKRMQSTQNLGRAFGMMLQLHPRKANFWVMAAKNEFEDNNNVDAARTLMQQALKVNPESKLLWREYCRLELLHVDKIRRRRELLSLSDKHDSIDVDNASEDFLNNKIASIVYNKAIEEVKDSVEFRLSFLPILRLFKNTSRNIDEVYESLYDFPNDAIALGALAKRPLEETKFAAKEANAALKDDTWKKAEEDCFDRFRSTAKEHASDTLWEIYTRTFLQLLMESKTRDQATRRMKYVLDVFATAEKEKTVTEQMYLSWGECCIALHDASGAIRCLQRASKVFPSCKSIWYTYLELKCSKGYSKLLNSEFERCLESTEEKDHIALWQLWIESCLDYFPKKAEEVFQEALKQSKDVHDYASLTYVDWTLEQKGVSEAVTLYTRLSSEMIRTPSLEFLKKGITLENSRDIPSNGRLRSLYEKILDCYGVNDVDVWLDYIRFEMNIPETATERVGQIYLRALKRLSGNLVAGFLSKLSLIQAGEL